VTHERFVVGCRLEESVRGSCSEGVARRLCGGATPWLDRKVPTGMFGAWERFDILTLLTPGLHFLSPSALLVCLLVCFEGLIKRAQPCKPELGLSLPR
jgi:hypothetical protein